MIPSVGGRGPKRRRFKMLWKMAREILTKVLLPILTTVLAYLLWTFWVQPWFASLLLVG